MRQFWTTTEIAVLVDLYPDVLASDVAALLGRSEKAVHEKAKAMSLRKSKEFMVSGMTNRIKRGYAPGTVRHQFAKGAVPWNFGVKGKTGLHPNSRATQFKPGRRPEESRNYQPIGALRISKDGYLERKMTDDHPVPARRWVAVHRLVWEAAHGPIPAGHIVVFRPGAKTVIESAVTPDRLECISRAENARRNHPRNRDPELGRLIQLKGAITRQVNRIAREAREQAA